MQKAALFIALLNAILLFPATTQGQNLDIDLLRRINLGRPQQLDRTFIGITQSAAPVSIGVPVSLVGTGLVTQNQLLQRQGLEVAASTLTAAALTWGLKRVIKRPRPYVTYPDIQNLRTESSFSFPSGHTTIAFSTATALSLIYPKWYVIAPSFLWASLVGYSRLHLGVHFPGDVLVGMVIGVGSGFLCHSLFKK